MKKRTFGTTRIAKICQVTPATVGRWIEGGKLPFFTTGGGHRRVWDADLRSFLGSHNVPIPSHLQASGVRVLIVDDEGLTRRMISRILGPAYPDIELYEAEDGFEAGHKIEELMPSLILLDIRLPGINGLKVCQWIRRNKKLRGTKVLVMTAFSKNRAKTKVLKAGANDFLSKPFDAETLLAKVSKLLNRKPES